MPSQGITDPQAQRIVTRFTRYLNGPMGKAVLQNLEENESFILQTSECSLRVTKIEGRAMVELVSPETRKANWLLNVNS